MMAPHQQQQLQQQQQPGLSLNIPLEGQLETFNALRVDVGYLHRVVAENKRPAKGEWAPLHYACYAGSLDMVQTLVQSKRMPIDFGNINKNTPFHVACYRGLTEICMYLMQKGANVKSKDKNGWSAIHFACYGGNAEIVAQMLKRGAKFKVTSNIGWTPMHCATILGRIEVADLLFNSGMRNLNDKDSLKNTPLHYASGNGHLQTANFLISKGAAIDNTNVIKQTPLHLACLTANVALIQLLIKNGADINAKDEEKRAPLHYASEKGHAEITTILTSHGADVNIKDRNDWTPLHYSFNAGYVHHSILLLSKGADFGAKDKRGAIPIAISLSNRFDTFHLEFMFGNLPIENSKINTALDKLFQLIKLHKTADFSNSGLFGFPPGLAFASFVQHLDLSQNHIHLYPSNLASFSSLRKLSLAHNELRSLPDHITALPALSSLDLSNNHISDLSPAVLHMRALEELNLSYNKFLMLPTFLANMPNLNVVLEGNLLTCIPPQIRNKDYKEILVYLKQLKEGSAAWGRLKLMLVGQEGVGKTSLLHALQKKAKSEVTQLLSTDGIEISSFVANKVQFRAWDFGGQLVFYPTHQFFLTRGCVYLVLFDLSKPNTIERVEYWLQQLKVLVFEDPLAITAIVIGTHADKDGAISIEEAQRRFYGKFPYVKGFLQVSNKSAKKQIGISAVVDKLLEISKDDKTFASIVPESYILLEGKLMQMVNSGVDYVEWAQYCEVGQSCGIQLDDLPFVTRFLHDAGILLHFQGLKTKSIFWENGANNRQMGGVVILNPQWLANVMASIVTFSHKWVKAGVLLHTDLAQVWKTKYNPDLWNLLLSLLEEFEVLYPLQGSPADPHVRKYLVPSLLPSLSTCVPAPVEVVQFEDLWRRYPQYNFRRVYSWDTMPVGYFPRLLLRLAHVSRQWQEGRDSTTKRDGTIRGISTMSSSNTSGPWVDGVILAHGAHIVFLRYLEGNVGGQPPAPKGSFHLEMRVTKNPSVDPEENLAPMLAQISHTICALSDTAYRQYKCHSSVYCSLCVANGNSYGHSFSYKECMDSMLQLSGLHCAQCNQDVTLLSMAPDIAFANVPYISPESVTIQETIGQGGFGKVYKGTLTTQEGVKSVAIKEAIGLEYEEDFQMLQHEVFLMSAIKHPNLVLFYGIAQQPTFQIIMEFVPGEDLNKLLFSSTEKNIKMGIEWQLRVAYDVACAMNYLHTLTPPITHRDLRSPNILILSTDPEAPVTAKVIDLGLAQQLAPNTYGGLETWQWMAPETILPTLKGAYSEKCDVYSFAIVLWEMVAQGRLPFEEHINEQIMTIKERIVKEGLRPIIPSECPPDFGRLIYDCWQGDPNLRPSFYQILFVLEKMLLSRNVNMESCKSHCMTYSKIGSSSSSSSYALQHSKSHDVRLGAMREIRTAPQISGDEGLQKPGSKEFTMRSMSEINL